MPIFDMLALYGFEPYRDGGIWWGIGSLVWGYTAYVYHEGDDYRIRYHRWLYDCEGECVCDDTDEIVLHDYEVLVYLVPRLPATCWRPHRHH